MLLSDSVVAMCTPVRDSHISFADLQLHSLLIIPRVQACEALARAQNGCEPTQLLARAETAHLHLGLHAPISSPFVSFRARLAEPLLEGFPCVADAPTRTVTAGPGRDGWLWELLLVLEKSGIGFLGTSRWGELASARALGSALHMVLANRHVRRFVVGWHRFLFGTEEWQAQQFWGDSGRFEVYSSG